MWQSLILTDGMLLYPLDDTYIHLALSENLSERGEWSMTSESFTSTSSSLLWTLALGGVNAFLGVRDWYPLALNAVFAIVLLVVCARTLRLVGLPPAVQVCALVLLVLVAPLPTLILMGLEHVLQTLLAVLFLIVSVQFLTDVGPIRPRRCAWLYVLALLATMVRFEGIFLVLIVAFFLALRGRIRSALAVTAFGFTPVVVYGAISIANGWFALPNSVYLKGSAPPLSSLKQLYQWTFDKLYTTGLNNFRSAPLFPLLVALVVGFVVSVRNRIRDWSAGAYSTAIVGLVLIVHAKFSAVGWFFRHEAYVVVLSVIVLAPFLPALRASFGRLRARLPRIVFVAVAILVYACVPLAFRAGWAIVQTPKASACIYNQHRQMGMFLAEHYNGESVVLHDIGAVCFYANIQPLDMLGLASMECARRKKSHGEIDAEFLEGWARREGASVAVVYEGFVRNEMGVDLSESWEKVGVWTIAHDEACGEDSVSFFSPGTEHRERLISALREFSIRLPDAVHESGAYIDEFE
jgi:hypothetical protein